MYLSKIFIGGAAAHNPYSVHQELWKIFADGYDTPRDFLFRVVQAGHMRAVILMQSLRKPELPTSSATILASKAYDLNIQERQHLRFFLVANPVKTKDDEGGRLKVNGDPKKCRIPLTHEDEQRAWLERKFQAHAQLEHLIIEPMHPIRFRKDRDNRAGKVQPVAFHGILTVMDRYRLTELIKKGIGPAKAFGCGMLSVARA